MKLCDSHIIPEFCYKPLYDSNHRFHTLRLDTETKDKPWQKGAREKLLCEACEQKLGKHEHYVSGVFFGGPEVGIETRPGQLVVHDVDYSHFKLFQLSVLWRACVSSHEMFTAVQLPEHEPTLRAMLLAEDPGPAERYGCVMILNRTADKVLVDFMLNPVPISTDPFDGVRFMFTGLTWLYVLAIKRPEWVGRSYSASPDNRVVIYTGVKLEGTELMRGLVRKLQSKGKLHGRKP